MSAPIIYKISANVVVSPALISKTTTNGKFPQWKFRRSSTSNVEPISRLRFQLPKKQILHLPTPGQRAHLPQQTAGRLLRRWSLAWSCSTPSAACPFPLLQALSASPPQPSRGPATASASPMGIPPRAGQNQQKECRVSERAGSNITAEERRAPRPSCTPSLH